MGSVGVVDLEIYHLRSLHCGSNQDNHSHQSHVLFCFTVTRLHPDMTGCDSRHSDEALIIRWGPKYMWSCVVHTQCVLNLLYHKSTQSDYPFYVCPLVVWWGWVQYNIDTTIIYWLKKLFGDDCHVWHTCARLQLSCATLGELAISGPQNMDAIQGCLLEMCLSWAVFGPTDRVVKSSTTLLELSFAYKLQSQYGCHARACLRICVSYLWHWIN